MEGKAYTINCRAYLEPGDILEVRTQHQTNPGVILSIRTDSP